MLPTNALVQLNIFANLPRVHLRGSENRSSLSLIKSSSERRGCCFFSSRDLRDGGSGPLVGVGGRSNGDTGAVVSENGDGAVGGGR